MDNNARNEAIFIRKEPVGEAVYTTATVNEIILLQS